MDGTYSVFMTTGSEIKTVSEFRIKQIVEEGSVLPGDSTSLKLEKLNPYELQVQDPVTKQWSRDTSTNIHYDISKLITEKQIVESNKNTQNAGKPKNVKIIGDKLTGDINKPTDICQIIDPITNKQNTVFTFGENTLNLMQKETYDFYSKSDDVKPEQYLTDNAKQSEYLDFLSFTTLCSDATIQNYLKNLVMKECKN